MSITKWVLAMVTIDRQLGHYAPLGTGTPIPTRSTARPPPTPHRSRGQ